MKSGRSDYDALFRETSIPTDEPRFIVRAQDECSEATVIAWACEAHGRGVDPAEIEMALQAADAMARWPVKKLPGVDYLTKAQRKDLRSKLSRRAWAARDDTGNAALMLAEERGRNAATAAFKRILQGDDFRAVLGLMNFETCPVAHMFRENGESIPRKVEAEQAYVLQWLLVLAFEFGDGWGRRASEEIGRGKAKLRSKLRADLAVLETEAGDLEPDEATRSAMGHLRERIAKLTPDDLDEPTHDGEG